MPSHKQRSALRKMDIFYKDNPTTVLYLNLRSQICKLMQDFDKLYSFRSAKFTVKITWFQALSHLKLFVVIMINAPLICVALAPNQQNRELKKWQDAFEKSRGVAGSVRVGGHLRGWKGVARGRKKGVIPIFTCGFFSMIFVLLISAPGMSGMWR